MTVIVSTRFMTPSIGDLTRREYFTRYAHRKATAIAANSSHRPHPGGCTDHLVHRPDRIWHQPGKGPTHHRLAGAPGGRISRRPALSRHSQTKRSEERRVGKECRCTWQAHAVQ